jgi:hypothetical protein
MLAKMKAQNRLRSGKNMDSADQLRSALSFFLSFILNL